MSKPWLYSWKYKNVPYVHFLPFLNTKMAHVFAIHPGGKLRTCLSHMIPTMAADDLEMQGAKASSIMTLTYISLNIPASSPEGLQLWLDEQNSKDHQIDIN